MTVAPQSTATPAVPVVLVLALPPAEREVEAERIDELRGLLDTAGRSVVALATQHLQRPYGATYIGSGKIEEVAEQIRVHGAREVCVGARLSPSQQRNLEEALKVHVLDYDELILEIFARNARTHQAMLAVELARSQYDRARLKRLWTHLDRQSAGGAKGSGSGFKGGPGEKQIEMDRRQVRRRIQDLQDRLGGIAERTERTIAGRDECYTIALVGYTNAGKSTLMNTLTRAGVLAEDRLFATLDTRTARLHLDEDGGAPRGPLAHVVLSDTVGFIRDLPPQLIASFHATLAEVREANLLLHVVDASSPAMERQVAAVEAVLEQIGASDVPAVMVFNKCDRAWSRTSLASFKRRYEHAVAVSALTGEGLDQLRQLLRERIMARVRTVLVRFPAADGALGAFVRRQAKVIEERYEGDETQLIIAADPALLGSLQANPGLSVEPVEPAAAG